jgi:ActR/RegA family two-component response regulator
VNRKNKILVVEDDIYIVENVYKEYLSSLDINVDYAQSKFEAIEKVRCKTYNAAFVDIMLREDYRDRGGIDVIEYLHKINEGTAIIVVSGTDDIKVALTTYRAGIVDFIQKENIHTKTDILNPLERILNNQGLYIIKYFGKYDNFSSYLASPNFCPSWEFGIYNTLGVTCQLMIDIFNNIFENFLPILRKKNTVDSLEIDSTRKCVHGIFWSKGEGYPIWFTAANKKGSLIEPTNELKSDFLKNYEKGDLVLSIWKIIDTKRDEFYESIWDELK